MKILITLWVIILSFVCLSQTNTFDNFGIITDRNIFDPNRHAIVRSTNLPPTIEWVLFTGTMTYSNEVIAVFDSTNTNYRVVLHLGDKLSYYKVKEITHEGVKLASPTNTIVVPVGRVISLKRPS